MFSAPLAGLGPLPGWMEIMSAYDAFLLVSFGGPEGPADVMPFLENVTRGRGIPRARLAEVAEHYDAFGGVSPINAQCREMLARIAKAFAADGIDLPLYWGNRNWEPFLSGTVRRMAAEGRRRVIAFTTSAYSSYSACRQYLDDIDRAVAEAGPGAPRIDKIRPYYRNPGFIEPFAASVEAALATLPDGARSAARLVFTAHSIPAGMAASSGSVTEGTAVTGTVGGRYAAELNQAATLISERVRGGTLPWDLVYQSRSGPPGAAWLEPDVNDHLRRLAEGGAASAVVLVPVGFVSDHMEVVHDLDVEAAQTAASLGLPLARAKAPGPTARFAEMVSELVADACANGPGSCPGDCCRYVSARPAGRPA
jgi:ferrochelatase